MTEYDAYKASIYDQYFTGVEGDVAFYSNEASRHAGRVLEIGCGTGRITIPLAQSGVSVTGLDNSPEMISVLKAKLIDLPAEVNNHIQIKQADMRTFDASHPFKQVLIPYRTFMHLLTPQDQIQALTNIHNHLAPKGRLLLNIYDPVAELAQMDTRQPALLYDTEFIRPSTGNRVLAWYYRRFDVIHQIISQQFIFEELDHEGTQVARHITPLTLRYTHRYEMHYLLELCGFRIDDLLGDFSGAPYSGSEQIWIARRID